MQTNKSQADKLEQAGELKVQQHISFFLCDCLHLLFSLRAQKVVRALSQRTDFKCIRSRNTRYKELYTNYNTDAHTMRNSQKRTFLWGVRVGIHVVLLHIWINSPLGC